jgi:hypothetical protein
VRLELGDRPGPVVVFTVGGRLGYLEETLASWASVRGAGNATFVFLVEPQDECMRAPRLRPGCRWCPSTMSGGA